MSDTARDDGTSVIEVVMTVVILGMLGVVLSAALVVTLREQPSTKGRVTVARSEQNVTTYLPNDLASAEFVCDAKPCVPAECTARWDDSLGLLLGWDLGGTPTCVAYRVVGNAIERLQCPTVGACHVPTTVVSAGVHSIAVSAEPASGCRRVTVVVDGDGASEGRGGGVNSIVIDVAEIARATLAVASTENAPTLANHEALLATAPAEACS